MNSGTWSKRRSGFHRGHESGRGSGQSNDSYQYKSQIQCHYCKKYGHKEVDCCTKQKDEQPQANFSLKGKLFMTHSQVSLSRNDV